MKSENNADLAITSMRKTQEYVLDRSTSPEGAFNRIEQDIQRVGKGSKQINQMEDQMNRMINVLNQKGLFNSDVIAAFTGLSLDKAKEFEGKLLEASELRGMEV